MAKEELTFDPIHEELRAVQGLVAEYEDAKEPEFEKYLRGELDNRNLLRFIGCTVTLEYSREGAVYDADDTATKYRGKDLVKGRLAGFNVVGETDNHKHLCLILENVDLIRTQDSPSFQRSAVWRVYAPVNGIQGWRSYREES